MAPRELSWPEIKYPTYRNERFMKTFLWLPGKQMDDGAENLWRIHDNLYDLTSFINDHPGGSWWLTFTKGTDITEAFEAHHITKTAEKQLPRFFVRKASTPRNSPFTFHPNGFYRTLKQKVQKHFNYKSPPPSKLSTMFLDIYFHGGLFLCVLAAQTQSILLALLAGTFFGFVVTAGHNFLHMKDSWRIYYYPCVAFSIKEWRIQHCLSHHLFPNTVKDLEIALFEPFLQFLPSGKKSLFVRMTSCLIFPVVCLLTNTVSVTTRFVHRQYEKNDFLMFLPPTMMLLFGNLSFYTLFLWSIVFFMTSFTFAVIGLTAAHHDDEVFHEGDEPREDRDWGLHQYDAVYDRNEIFGNRFFGMIMFGEHALHHLFPTIDFCHLQELIPIYEETLKEFGIDGMNNKPILKTVVGTFKQLTRNEPHSFVKEAKKIN